MLRRSAPKTLRVPDASAVGPSSTSDSPGASAPASPRDQCSQDRGSLGWETVGSQYHPWPGASAAAASGSPSMTASAPQAIALAASPPEVTSPYATRCTYPPPVS